MAFFFHISCFLFESRKWQKENKFLNIVARENNTFCVTRWFKNLQSNFISSTHQQLTKKLIHQFHLVLKVLFLLLVFLLKNWNMSWMIATVENEIILMLQRWILPSYVQQDKTNNMMQIQIAKYTMLTRSMIVLN